MRTMAIVLGVAAAVGCTEPERGVDPETAERAPIDRFSDGAGTRLRRSGDATLPGPNVAIDVDARFAMVGLGPAGERVTVYEFDVQPREPAPIYVFFKPGRSTPMKDQLNVVPVIPGDAGYNDLWRVVKVNVPDDYVANTVTSVAEIVDGGFALETTDDLVNCPVVPEGSVARKRMPGDYAGLHQGWYGGRIIQYFHFGEKPLAAVDGLAGTSTIHVAYAIDPGQPGGGAAAGYMREPDGDTHNVVATLPSDGEYWPLWSVRPYANAAFATVTDLATAEAAAPVADDEAIVNAPIVAIE